MTTTALSLQAQTREARKKQVTALRSAGIVPAVVYGHNKENQLIQVDLREFIKLYEQAGESTLVNLAVDGGEPVKVLVHSVDHEGVTDKIQHIDFYAVNMSEKVQAEVELHFVGESAAVKAMGGTLVKQKDHLAVKCLPQDLIKEVEVDISVLATFEDSIHVKDVALPEALEKLDDLEDTVAAVSAPRSEEEMAALDEDVNEDVSHVADEDKPAEGEGAKKEAAPAEGGEGEKSDN